MAAAERTVEATRSKIEEKESVESEEGKIEIEDIIIKNVEPLEEVKE